jgi:hypothetical protein
MDIAENAKNDKAALHRVLNGKRLLAHIFSIPV